MYIYHAFINALSARMIHSNLNAIFYTHVEHSPSKTIYIKYYMETHAYTHTRTHTHTHDDYSRNLVLILVGVEILWEEEGFQSGFTIWQGWAVSKVLSEWIPNVVSKARKKCKSHDSCVCIAGFSACGCRKKSVVHQTECRHVAVQRVKQDLNHL